MTLTFWRREQKEKLIYKFYCNHCDTFIYKEDYHDNRCPGCFNKMTIYDTLHIKDN